ncbi:MAG: hypothetical protein HYZ37_08035 [Candidatus Solibacter usitatus]|nr:hypothetical protein [Candidatus Solibacter usitatus]
MKTTETKTIDLDVELAALERMNVPELRERHADLFSEAARPFHLQVPRAADRLAIAGVAGRRAA